MRIRWLIAPLLLALATLGLTAPSHADPTVWKSAGVPDYEGFLHNATIAVADPAQIKNKGLSIEEKIQFTCPKGKQYTVTYGEMSELNPPRYTYLQVAGDGGIDAPMVGHPTGKCTGKPQELKLRFDVVPTPGWDAGCTNSFPQTICWEANPGGLFSVEPNQGPGEIDVRIAGDDFYAEYVAYAASCCSNGTVVKLVQ